MNGYVASRVGCQFHSGEPVYIFNSRGWSWFRQLLLQTIQRPVLSAKRRTTGCTPLHAKKPQLRNASLQPGSNVCVAVYHPERRGK